MTETDETAIRPGRVSIEIRPLWDPLRGRHVSGGEAAPDDAPAQDDAAPAGAARKAPDAPRGRGGAQWRSVRPESSAGKVLALLQAGWTDPAAMDDELDLKTGVAARLVGSLRKAGLWSPPDPAP